MADLNLTLMPGFLREVGSSLADDAPALSGEALGRHMNVVGRASESAMPKNVGLLFFNEFPSASFPARRSTCSKFRCASTAWTFAAHRALLECGHQKTQSRRDLPAGALQLSLRVVFGVWQLPGNQHGLCANFLRTSSYPTPCSMQKNARSHALPLSCNAIDARKWRR